MAIHRLQQLQTHLTSSTSNMSESIFFGQECVNRVSFLRENTEFIHAAVSHDSTRFIVLKDGIVYGLKDKAQVWYARYADLKAVIDPWAKANETGVELDGVKVTFLGLNESQQGMAFGRYAGVAYFGIDIGAVESMVSKLSNDGSLELCSARNTIFTLSNFDASMYSHAKMYLDWMNRNRFCAGCGRKNVVIQAGTKLQCSSDKEKDQCPVKTASVSNVSFPRTDCVVITATTTKKYDKVLLARGKRHPMPMYSCVAGFMEPSETVEDASLREVWEETGVKAIAGDVDIVETQPWPYPANLMIGCIVFVEFNGVNEVIDLGHDPELLDAKWVNIEEVEKVLSGEVKKDWFIPPATAIAHSLIKLCVDRYHELNK